MLMIEPWPQARSDGIARGTDGPREQVDLEDRPPLLVRELGDRAVGRAARGVVDEHGQRAELGDRCVDERVRRRGIGDVGRDEASATAATANDVFAAGAIASRDDHGGALLREAESRSLARCPRSSP